jgi:predicted nucleic acid-binding protein
MIKVFIDTNVIIDLIANREPFSEDAIQLFSLGERKKSNYTSLLNLF